MISMFFVVKQRRRMTFVHCSVTMAMLSTSSTSSKEIFCFSDLTIYLPNANNLLLLLVSLFINVSLLL